MYWGLHGQSVDAVSVIDSYADGCRLPLRKSSAYVAPLLQCCTDRAGISVLLGPTMQALAIGHVGSHALLNLLTAVSGQDYGMAQLFRRRTLLSNNLLLFPFCPSSL